MLALLAALVGIATRVDFHLRFFLSDDAQVQPPRPAIGSGPVALRCIGGEVFLDGLREAADHRHAKGAFFLKRLRARAQSCASVGDVGSVRMLEFLEAAMCAAPKTTAIVQQVVVQLAGILEAAIAPVSVPFASLPHSGPAWALRSLSPEDPRMKLLEEQRLLHYWCAGRGAAAECRHMLLSFVHDGTRVGGKAVHSLILAHPTNFAYYTPMMEPLSAGEGVH